MGNLLMTNILFRRRKLGNGTCRGIQAVSTQGLTMVRNDSPLPADLRYVFRWGCTSSLPAGNAIVVNKASAIHWCSDKRQGRLDMQAAGVSVPRTWGSWGDMTRILEPGSYQGNLPDLKVVLRPSQHSQGKQLFVFNGHEAALAEKCQELGHYYISELINKVAEYRVMVVQNRVAWVAQKTPGNPEDVAWNVSQGGRFDNVRWDNWPMAVVAEALKAARVSGTDFSGVDVMVDVEGKVYVLELNSAPSQTSPYRQSCLAKAFDYIVVNGKKHLPDPAQVTGYRSVIHPALMVGRDG